MSKLLRIFLIIQTSLLITTYTYSIPKKRFIAPCLVIFLANTLIDANAEADSDAISWENYFRGIREEMIDYAMQIDKDEWADKLFADLHKDDLDSEASESVNKALRHYIEQNILQGNKTRYLQFAAWAKELYLGYRRIIAPQGNYSDAYHPSQILGLNAALVLFYNGKKDGKMRLKLNPLSLLGPAQLRQATGLIISGELEEPKLRRISGARPSFSPGYDSRKNGLETPVRDQGNCGSCWAFAATDWLRITTLKAFGVSLALSEEQLVNCVPKSRGCQGGSSVHAWKYLAAHPSGQTFASIYPYTARDNECRSDIVDKGVVKPIGDIHAFRDEEQIMRAIRTYGAVAIGVSASPLFRDYGGGILSKECRGNIDHMIILVGWGSDERGEYWIGKNQWGTDWGAGGYVFLERADYPGTCNMLQLVIAPQSVNLTGNSTDPFPSFASQTKAMMGMASWLAFLSLLFTLV